MKSEKVIIAHVLVKNEARFIWYSIMSVLPHVNRVRLWDMGSTDGTRAIINQIINHPLSKGKVFYSDRIVTEFKEDRQRQEMLDEDSEHFGRETDKLRNLRVADWIIVVDGDEIWWDESIKKLVKLIREEGDNLESIVVPVILPIGDMFHFQEKEAGRYKFGKRHGHYALRAFSRHIPGISSHKPHGQWGWTDAEGKMIQDRDPKKIGFIEAPYIHVTHLPRAGSSSEDETVLKRKMKLKHEIGIPFPKDFFYPEVFFRSRPSIVASPWQKMSFSFRLLSFIQTPFRKIKRRLFKGKTGY